MTQNKKMSLADKARWLFNKEQFVELQQFKRGRKKSWTSLGFTDAEVKQITSHPEPRTEITPRKIYGTTADMIATDEVIKPLPKKLHPSIDNLRVLKYTPRVIHQIMGEVSHPIVAHMAEIRTQEELRADPRFPLAMAMKRHKRYQDIFRGRPYLPIFG